MTPPKDVLVFGAGGFIGTYLTDELLKQGYAVTASDLGSIGETYYREAGVPYVPIDITRKEAFDQLRNARFDSVIHLAALQPANFTSRHEPRDYIHINVVGTVNILEFCRTRQVKTIIYASSHRNTSGLWAQGRPITEADGRSLHYAGEYSMFSISETAAQDCVEHYRAQYGLRGIVFRLPPVYGFGPHLEIFRSGKPVKTGFQTFIENARACQPLEVWGDTSVGRDIIYVKDVVAACLRAIERENAAGLYNITSGYRLTLKEEAETIARVFWGDAGPPVIVLRPEKPHAMDSFVYDNSKAKRELGWSPQYDFEGMLRDYKQQLETMKFSHLVEKRKAMIQSPAP
jgi:UDP-glucose 4-epimerase